MKHKKRIKRKTSQIILIRFIELLITSIVISSAVNTIHLSNIFGQENETLFIMLLIGFLIFAAFHIRKLRQCFYALHNIKRYCICNFTAYLLFVALSMSVFLLLGNVAYAWMFSIFKFLRYCPFELHTILSAAVAHSIMLISIVAAPAGMRWVLETNRRKQQRKHR
ncbi:MAG: hypothetical protein IJ002_04040 [Clostridia bacterium]|nr:hypothetical protein [Clostridia bacterium]